eukprot:c20227_g1_i2.p1 GENE.c20227_g1_i2~~c20227_g1_i2.p1  ORF type:complete len:264 (+),score=43.86 c20227_g1_i2:335-1126(+)
MSVIVWDVEGLASGSLPTQKCTLLGHTTVIRDVALSEDGRLAASAAWDGSVRVWDLSSGTCHMIVAHDMDVRGVSFIGSGQIVTGSADSSVKIFESDGPQQCSRSLTNVHSVVSGVHSVGNVLATVGWDGVGKTFSVGALTEMAKFNDHAPHPILACCLSPDGSLLATGDDTGRLRVRRLSNHFLSASKDYSEPVVHLSYSPTQYWLLVVTQTEVEVLEIESAEPVATWAPPSRPLCAQMTAHDQVIVGCKDGSILVWKVKPS